MTAPICMNGQTTKFTVSRLNSFSSRPSMKFGGAKSANIFIKDSRPLSQRLPARAPSMSGGGQRPDGHALEVNHLQLVRVVVGDVERLAVGRLPELAREDARRHAARDGRLPFADARRVNHGQGLPRRLVAREAGRVGGDDLPPAVGD